MSAMKPTIHVVFELSAAYSVRQALGIIGRKEDVFGFSDNLSCGMINAPTLEERQESVATVTGYDLDDMVDGAELFWASVTSREVMPVVWVFRGDAAHHAGFLEFVRRIGDQPFCVIDVTGVEVVGPRGPFSPKSLSSMNPTQIIAAGLVEPPKTLSAEEIDRYRTTWAGLMHENAPFRVVQDGELFSAPLTHFDEIILSRAPTEWQVAARLAANLLEMRHHGSFKQCPGDLVLWGRICALAEAGKLEIRGDGVAMRGSEVRLASGQPTFQNVEEL